jgi:5-oxoprolinase (ATP-hydrolysing)
MRVTYTEVARLNGNYKIQIDNEIAGNKIRIPVLRIHLVDVGGVYILFLIDLAFMW